MTETLFLIVDDDTPEDQAAQLQESLQVAGLNGNVDFATSPAEMLEKIRDKTPSLILLDHRWAEVGIEKVLQDLRRDVPTTRVVLYTGKKIEPSVIIECARYGVAEYLMKSSLAGDTLAKKLSMLANDPDKTLERLGPPSGAIQQLIQEARKNLAALDTEREVRLRVEKENEILRSGDRRDMRGQVARFVASMAYLLAVAALAWWVERLGNWLGFACFIIGAMLGVIILDRTVSDFAVRVGKRFHITLRRKP